MKMSEIVNDTKNLEIVHAQQITDRLKNNKLVDIILKEHKQLKDTIFDNSLRSHYVYNIKIEDLRLPIALIVDADNKGYHIFVELDSKNKGKQVLYITNTTTVEAPMVVIDTAPNKLNLLENNFELTLQTNMKIKKTRIEELPSYLVHIGLDGGDAVTLVKYLSYLIY